MENTKEIYYATSEDEESWHHQDPAECAKEKYDDDEVDKDGYITIYQGTLNKLKSSDIIPKWMDDVVYNWCDNADIMTNDLDDCLDKIKNEDWDDLKGRFCKAFKEWCEDRDTAILDIGVIENIYPIKVKIAQ